MSLAMYAAPFNDNIKDNDDSDNVINRKRQHNKTQKRFSKGGFDTDKVNSVLEKIHESTDDGDTLGDFNPPPIAESAGVERTIVTEQMHNMSNETNKNMFKLAGMAPKPNNENSDKLDMNSFTINYGDAKSVEEYYKKMLPSYANKNPVNKQYYANAVNHRTDFAGGEQDVLLNKLNYMISLLEEKQDERTNNVTEEVVLYSFLGIFIIFIVDSFSKVGKYVR